MFNLLPLNYRESNPYHYMNELEKNFFSSAINGSAQFRCDISEKENHYLLEAELPGFDKDDIHIELNGDVLTVSASHATEENQSDENGKYIRRERRYGSFSRRFDVTGIDTNAIEADYKNGILNVTLPKAKEPEAPAARKIDIK